MGWRQGSFGSRGVFAYPKFGERRRWQLCLHGLWTIANARRYIPCRLLTFIACWILAYFTIRCYKSGLQPYISVRGCGSRRSIPLGWTRRVWRYQSCLLPDISSIFPHFSPVLPYITILLSIFTDLFAGFSGLWWCGCRKQGVALFSHISSLQPDKSNGWYHISAIQSYEPQVQSDKSGVFAYKSVVQSNKPCALPSYQSEVFSHQSSIFSHVAYLLSCQSSLFTYKSPIFTY